MEPRSRFQGMNSASLYVACRAGTITPIHSRFLAPIDCLKIPALLGMQKKWLVVSGARVHE
jgi:hypothetical protein